MTHNSKSLVGFAHTMAPVDVGADLAELLKSALFNCDQYDKIPRIDEPDAQVKEALDLRTHRAKFEDGLARVAQRHGWTVVQCNQVRDLKKACPPDRVYRVTGGFASSIRGSAPIGVIVSYRPGQHGGPAEAGIAVLGFKETEKGSAADPMGVPASGLEDVTEAARAGTLPELHVR